MLKRILLLLITLSAALILLITFEEADRNEQVNRSKVLVGLGTAFSIPNTDVISEPEVFWPILRQTAEKHHVNVFRKASGFDSEEKPLTHYYALLTSDNTDFSTSFRLRSGTFLDARDTQNKSLYLSSTPADDPNQVGVIEDIGRNDHYFIFGMEKIFDAYPVAGIYLVEAASPEDEALFCSDLEEALVQLGVETGLSVGSDGSLEGPTFSSKAPLSQTAIWLTIVAVVIMIVYRQLYESKRTAVMRLYGYSSTKIWFFISGRLIIVTTATLIVVSYLVAFLIPGSTTDFAVTVLTRLGGLAVLLLLASLTTILFIRAVDIHEALKNRKDTRVLVILNVIVKSFLCLVLIYMGAVNIGWHILNQTERDRLGNWEQTSQYGIFYPLYTGVDASEPTNSTTQEIVFGLYPALNSDGALFIETNNFSTMALQYETPYRSIRVNLNYLEVYPVNDAEENPVIIEENETDWILLVPESYRAEEEAILKHWGETRLGYGEAESVWEADLRMLGRTVDAPKPDQSVRIVWTATDQQVFSFNPEVYPENNNNIEDPIIEVMTMGNSAGLDKANGVDGGLGASVKVKLIEGSMTATYEKYLPLLKDLGLDDNVKQLVTLDEAIYSLMQEFDQALERQYFQIAMVFALFLILAIQSVPLLFELDSRRAAVRRLYGYPFLSRQRKFFLIYSCVWAGVFVIAIALNSSIGLPLGWEHQDITILFAVAGVFLAIETLIATATLSFVESRRTVDILKGEF